MQVYEKSKKNFIFKSYDEIKNNPNLYIEQFNEISYLYDNLPHNFKDRLKGLRKHLGLTREMLEELSHISVQTIKRIESNDNVKFYIETIVSLCIGMHLPPEVSFDLIKRAGFNIELYCSKKYAVYCFILRCLYMNKIDEVNDFLIQCGEKALNFYD